MRRLDSQEGNDKRRDSRRILKKAEVTVALEQNNLSRGKGFSLGLGMRHRDVGIVGTEKH